jgi:hypothetical protein
VNDSDFLQACRRRRMNVLFNDGRHIGRGEGVEIDLGFDGNGESVHEIADCRFQIADSLQIADCRLQIADFRFQIISDGRFRWQIDGRLQKFSGDCFFPPTHSANFQSLQ